MKKRSRLLSILLAGAMVLGCTGCGGTDSTDSKTGSGQPASSVSAETENVSSQKTDGEKKDLVIMITSPGSTINVEVEEYLIEQLGDKYNIIAKAWDSAALEQTVKTAAAADEQIDLVQYWPNQMSSFISVDLATDLTPYMDDEWKSHFGDTVLDIGTYDGKLYNVPYKSVYPLMIVDLEVTRAAGIADDEIKDSMTWEEFLELCRRVQENTDASGAAVFQNNTCWLVRNALMQVWDNNSDLDKWNSGQVSFLDEKIVKAFDMVKEPFEEGLFYPGEGALAVTEEQIYGAMSSHKIAFIFQTNSGTKTYIENSGLTEYKICDYPKMGSNPVNPVLGGCDGYFIPACSKNVEGAVEAMKILTGEEVMTKRAEAGQVVCADTSENASVDPDFMNAISRSSSSIYPTEIVNIDAELSSYLMNQMPANYIYNGIESLNELEELRKAAVE